jgi:hypothetical protein
MPGARVRAGGTYAAAAATVELTVVAAVVVAATGFVKATGAAEAVPVENPATAIAAADSAVAPTVTSFLPCVRAMLITSSIDE